jgi:hypothetical protein
VTVALVAAANPPAVAVDGWDLAAPVANRLMHLDWLFDADAWLDGVVTDFAHIDPPSLEAMLGVRSDVDAIRVKGAVTAFLKARPDLQLALPTDPEPVKPFETSDQFFLCVSLVMVGLLIQAMVGIFGGQGRRLQNRRGLAA